MVAVVARVRLESALAKDGTTVTAFLEGLVGEPVDANERRHVMTSADSPNLLDLAEGERLLRRSALLQGRRSGQSYVYARSLIVPGRLPPEVCRQLETSSLPIGRILEGQGIGFRRSPLAHGWLKSLSLPGDSPPPDDYLLQRGYRIEVEGQPTMVIGEWFLSTLETFLGRC